MPCYSRKLAKGIKWYYKFDLNGVTYHSKCIYDTKTEAKKAEAKAMVELKKGPDSSIALSEAIKERLDYIKLVKSEKYYIDSKRYLESFYNSLGYDLLITDITEKHISEYLMKFANELKSKGKKNYSVNASIRCLKAFFNHQKVKNPVSSKMFPIEKRLKYVPPDSEIEAVLNICDSGQRQLVEFVRDTGCRIGEALRLTAEDVFDDYVVLYTRKSKNSNLTPRRLPLPNCLKGQNLNGRIFSRWNNTPDFLDEKVVKLNFQRWSWHNLRHRYASLLSKSGVPIFEIMSKLGHSSLTTTQIYLQLIP